MTKKIFLSMLILGLNLLLHAQVMTYTDLNFNSNSYNVFTVKIDPSTVKNFDIVQNKYLLQHKNFADSISIDSSVFIINASISDTFCNPIGYYIKNSQIIKPINLNKGIGNFYLKPNGALLFTDDDAIICESSQIIKYKNVRLGIQSGPMLVCNDTINSNFNRNSVNKNIRCGIGIKQNKKKENMLVFCISNTPVTFYEFSVFFNERFNCKNALCLESAGCAMNLPYLSSEQEKFTNIICNYIIYRSK